MGQQDGPSKKPPAAGIAPEVLEAWQQPEDPVPQGPVSASPAGSGSYRAGDIRASLKDPQLRIVSQRLLERLLLERRLCWALFKLGTFLAYVVCFFCVLQGILPSDEASAVRRQLESILGLANVGSVTSSSTILAFAGSLARSLETRRATAESYWCKASDMSVHMDYSTGAAYRVCSAPSSVGLGHEHQAPWVSGRRLSEVDGAEDFPSSTPPLAADAWRYSAAADRKLSAAVANPSCVDQDASLATLLGQSNATCVGKKHNVCSLSDGPRLCPVTCGVCPPFRFTRLKEFVGPGVAIMPLVFYQTRFAAKSCDDFLEDWRGEMATARPAFASSPTSLGERGASMGTCVDREKHQTSDYAMNVPCPARAGTACAGGKSELQVTPKRTFRGETVYAQMLLRPDVDLARMQALEWVDAFTDTATLSALVYTESLEVFTLLSVDFTSDLAGNAAWKVRSRSWKDLMDGAKDHFLIREILLLVFAFLGVLHSCLSFRGQVPRSLRNSGCIVFEICTRLLLLITSVVVIVWANLQDSMSSKCEEALRSFLSLDDPDLSDGGQQALDAFFNIADSIYARTEALNWLCLACFLVAMVQGVQWVMSLYDAHPGIATTALALRRAFSALLHLAVLLVVVFFIVAFLFHWMLGRSMSESETFGQALASQLRIAYGEYIYLPGAARLEQGALIVYWIYAVIFLIFVFLIIRFILLAAIVRGFAEAKASGLALRCTRSFVLDSFDVLTQPILAASYGWPSRQALIIFLQNYQGNVFLRPGDMGEVFTSLKKGGNPQEDGAFSQYLSALSCKAPEALCLLPEGFAEERPPSKPKTEKAKSGGMPRPDAQATGEPPVLEAAEVHRLAESVVHQVTNELAMHDLHDVRWLNMTGKVTTVLYREFSAHGLIRQ